MIPKRSPNYRILRNILSKIRQIDFTEDVSYIIIYAFLYKYASDIIKDYLMSVLSDKGVTLYETYKNKGFMELFRNESLEMFGYFINDSDFFIDEVINSSYADRFFIYRFFDAFTEHVEFANISNYGKYFNFIFDAVKSEINLKKFEFEGENHLIVKEIIYAISQLDVLEKDCPYEEVFNIICTSRLIRVERDPEYVTQILAEIISRSEIDIENIYSPFLNDGSSLISLKNNLRWHNSYGKSSEKITYCASIVKLFINDFDLDEVFLEFSSPFESVDINATSFDAIISKIPNITPKNIKRLNRSQNIERVRNSKRKQLLNVLADDFAVDGESLLRDAEFNSAIDNLINKMDLEKEAKLDFHGEYEVLKDSEYLFLINLINSLKSGGIMALSMSQSFLFKNSLETLRKYLTVEKNYIDAIISLPDEFSRPRASDIIVIFKKNRKSDNIVFVDMSKNYDTVRMPITVPGTFRKNLLFSKHSIEKVADVLSKRKVVERFSNVVSLNELVKNDFNLAISRYVDTFEGEFISLDDLAKQKKEIDENLVKLNKKIDVMMSDLNIRF